eukprot:scaffold667_cov103-Skeletonema_dohrnii-CCMP3373.AAC.7
MNQYYTALMLLQLGMLRFAQAVYLSSGEEINQVNLRESMDELREKQLKMDLQKMPAEQRNNISKALKGTKLSAEHSIAIGLDKKISKAERAIEEGGKYKILEYECIHD